ncbi:MAG: hypothetical protein K0U86_23110 [Planctomycetes bacterium]|uniref:hypothetical protein n=1 Tax=uncultured Gimesia sp. TaxID=1678688 RepID=UPI00262E0813|nr:hypothetical protein [uncultured Gimesia sp.]MCH9652236.1 hypothetical protein [Planctomycetota bacterium]MCH9727801.1 hypothetical protein [Planctomycetota bacterium]MCH9776396.1 hypothetical protein [Planctomycetota bacterium]MDF1744818.1 hypothetical protein [Gimesia sp.]
MDVWNLILYVVASVLALKSLASLMTHHKKVVVQQLAIEYTQETGQNGNTVPHSDSSDQQEENASEELKMPAA